jgi:hypothetical protein
LLLTMTGMPRTKERIFLNKSLTLETYYLLTNERSETTTGIQIMEIAINTITRVKTKGDRYLPKHVGTIPEGYGLWYRAGSVSLQADTTAGEVLEIRLSNELIIKLADNIKKRLTSV